MSIVQEKMYMDVDDVCAILGVSKAYAYNLMREYNKELKANDQMYMYRQSPNVNTQIFLFILQEKSCSKWGMVRLHSSFFRAENAQIIILFEIPGKGVAGRKGGQKE